MRIGLAAAIPSKSSPVKQYSNLTSALPGDSVAVGQPVIRVPVERSANLLDRLIFASSLILIALTAVPYGTAEPWWKATFECAVFALGLLWMAEGLVSGSWGLRGHRWIIPLLLLIAFSYIQTLPLPLANLVDGQGAAQRPLSSDPYTTRLFILNLTALVVLGGLLIRYVSNMKRLRTLVYLVVFIGAGSALFGIVRQSTQHGSGFLLPYLMPGKGYGQFINHNHFAFLMEMTLGLLIALIFGGGVRRSHVPTYLGAALLVSSALILSNSRGGIIGMISEMLFLTIVLSNERSRSGNIGQQRSVLGRFPVLWRSLLFRIVFILCVTVGLVLSIIWIGGEPVVHRFESAQTSFSEEGAQYGGNTSRKDIWTATWNLIEHNPVAGVGFGGYWMAITKYHDAPGTMTPQEAHNDYLELLASGGVVGALLVAWFFINFAFKRRSQLVSHSAFQRTLSIGALAGILAVAVHSISDFGLHITCNAAIFTVLVVIGVQSSFGGKKKHSGVALPNL